MLDGREKTGADVPVASPGVDSSFLEPLWAEHVRALQCFLAEWCALARAEHAFVRLCGAGGSASRVR